MASDRLNFLIYEESELMQKKLRSLLTDYSVKYDVDLQMDWMIKPEQIPYLNDLAPQTHIAFLNGDQCPGSLDSGRALLRCNPQCLILYYGNRTMDLARYFQARPICYLDFPVDPVSWEMEIFRYHQMLRESCSYFSWISKSCRYYLPVSQIVCIRSSRTMLEVQMSDGTAYSFPGKLDDAQSRLPKHVFLRIHKSMLIGVSYVQALDKADRCFLLTNGVRAYISKAHYKEASLWMDNRGETP